MLGRGARVRGPEPHPPPALRAHRTHVGLEPVLAAEPRPVVAHRDGDEVVLEIGVFDSRPAADESPRLELVRGARAAPV